MFKSGVLGFVCKVSHFISSLTALAVGLCAAGIYDVNKMLVDPMMKMYVHYAIGVAGLISLIGLMMHAYACMCGADSCCNGSGNHRH